MAISMKGQAAWGLHDRWRDEARGQGRHGDCRRGKPCVCVCVCVCVRPQQPSVLLPGLHRLTGRESRWLLQKVLVEPGRPALACEAWGSSVCQR